VKSPVEIPPLTRSWASPRRGARGRRGVTFGVREAGSATHGGRRLASAEITQHMKTRNRSGKFHTQTFRGPSKCQQWNQGANGSRKRAFSHTNRQNYILPVIFKIDVERSFC
jgi:hypothetical protein